MQTIAKTGLQIFQIQCLIKHSTGIKEETEFYSIGTYYEHVVKNE